MVASLADVIRAHNEFILQPQASQVVQPSTFSITIDNSVHAQANFDHKQAGDVSRKPPAKQILSPLHGSINKIDSLQSTQLPFSYISMTNRQGHESQHSKRQKLEETVAYASIVSHDPLSLPPPASIQNDTLKIQYESRQDHWSAHTSDNFINNHHLMNNDQKVHDNISLNAINHQNSSMQTVVPHNTIAECSTDQDYG